MPTGPTQMIPDCLGRTRPSTQKHLRIVDGAEPNSEFISEFVTQRSDVDAFVSPGAVEPLRETAWDPRG